MAEPDSKPSPLSLLLSSRKGLVFFVVLVLVGIAAIGFEIAIVILCIRGRMEIQAAMTLAFGGVIIAVIGAVISAWKLLDGITLEDVSKRAQPTIAAGGDVKIETAKPVDGSTPS